MPSRSASFATKVPIEPKPITPKVFPFISLPTNCFSPSRPVSALEYYYPLMILPIQLLKKDYEKRQLMLLIQVPLPR